MCDNVEIIEDITFLKHFTKEEAERLGCVEEEIWSTCLSSFNHNVWKENQC
jgi:hypothetical protein